MSEREREGDDRVEDLDVPESEGEDVKGGAFDAFNKVGAAGIKGELKLNPAAVKISPESLNFNK